MADNDSDEPTSMVRRKNAMDANDRANAARGASPQAQGAFQPQQGAFQPQQGAFGGAPASGGFLSGLFGPKPAY
jgi:hypothetical protein